MKRRKCNTATGAMDQLVMEIDELQFSSLSRHDGVNESRLHGPVFHAVVILHAFTYEAIL